MGQFRGLVFYLIFLGLFEWDFVNCKKRHGYFSNDIDVLDNDDDEDLLSVDNESARYPRVQVSLQLGREVFCFCQEI